MAHSGLRLNIAFPEGSLFTWIDLGLLWSFQSHKKGPALSFQLKKKRKQYMTFYSKSSVFISAPSLEVLLQQERGLSAWDPDTSSNEGLEQVLGRCVFFKTVTGSLCDLVATLKHVTAKY